MFKALLRTKFAALFVGLFLRNNTQSNKPTSKLKLIGFGALMLYACFAFMMMFGVYFQQIAKPFFESGIGWLYFTLFGITAFAMMFIGSVFTVKSQLYEAKDNDLLLAMPIPPRLILASRMVMLMILNFVFELLVAAPAFVVWLRATTVSVGQVAVFVLFILALPLLSMAVSGLFGWLLALSTSRMRKSALMTVLFSVIFLGLYLFFFSKSNVYIQQLIQNGTQIAGSLGTVAPLYWFGNAIVGLDLIQILTMLVIMALPYLLMYYLLSTTFISVATSKRGQAKIKYTAREMRSSSPSSALFKRELGHLLSSPVYILNAGLGVIFILIAGVAIIIKKSVILALLTQINIGTGAITALLVLALCLMSATVLFTAPSVSLEGKSIWIIKSLPVLPQEALKAKLRLHIYITAPSVILASAAGAYVFASSLFEILILLIAPLAYLLLSANIGLICNLNSVNLNWVNETQVVKQSASVIIAMLVNSLVVIIPGALYLLVLSGLTVPFMAGYTLLIIIGWRLSYAWILTKGAEKFDVLG